MERLREYARLLVEIGVNVQTGQTVSRGDTVGTTTDVHDLIYELRIGNKSVDPAAAIKGSSGLQYQENK